MRLPRAAATGASGFSLALPFNAKGLQIKHCLPGSFQALHQVFIPAMGLLIGESCQDLYRFPLEFPPMEA